MWKFRPGASHGGRLWLLLLVIGVIGAVGLVLVLTLR